MNAAVLAAFDQVFAGASHCPWRKGSDYRLNNGGIDS